MINNRGRLVLLVLFILLFTSACGLRAQPASGKPTIKIGYLPITHAGPHYIDDHLHDGQYEGYRVEMVRFGSWPDLMDALNTGRIDGASVLVELAMKAREKGIDLKAVALGHREGNVVITDETIDRVSDLKGESFAIPHTYSSHNILLNEMLEADGLSYEDVNVVEMPPAEMPAALAGGRIAGYVVAEPFGAMALALEEGKVLHHASEIWSNLYCCVLVLRNDFIKENEDLTESLVSNYVHAGEHAEHHQEDVYEAFEKYMQVDREVLELSLEWINFDQLRIEKGEYDALRNAVLEMGLMENPPTYEELVDNTFIDKVM